MSFLATLKRWFGLSSSVVPDLKAGDKLLVCEDCGNKFVFDAGEQIFFKEKGFTEPKRCPTCRKKVRRRLRHRVFSLALSEHSVQKTALTSSPIRKLVLRALFVHNPYKYHVSESSKPSLVLRAKRPS